MTAVAAADSAVPVLAIEGLRVSFPGRGRPLAAVDGIDLEVAPAEVLGLVGESGSGKSVTLRAIVGLIRPPGRVTGRVRWGATELVGAPERALRVIRGRDIAMIFQEPMTALNPVLTVGRQIDENLRAHTELDGSARRRRAVELLDLVGIPAARARIDDYPHQFSGGMRQRAMIAMAIASRPQLLLADEPTTALDVTIQDQILKLLLGLRDELGMAMILVTHDLGVVAQTCDRVAVMYAGRIAETGPVAAVFRSPRHAYTAGLMAALPDQRARRPLRRVPGAPPPLSDLPPGCAFAPRCELAIEACRQDRPPLVELGQGRRTACLRHGAVALRAGEP